MKKNDCATSNLIITLIEKCQRNLAVPLPSYFAAFFNLN